MISWCCMPVYVHVCVYALICMDVYACVYALIGMCVYWRWKSTFQFLCFLYHKGVLNSLNGIMLLYAYVCARVYVCDDMYGCIWFYILFDRHVCILTLNFDFSIFMFSLSQRRFNLFEWYHAVVCLCLCTYVCVWWYVWMYVRLYIDW